MRDDPVVRALSPSDLTLRTGRYIPDAPPDASTRTGRIEIYLMQLSEELEQLLPALAGRSGDTPGTPDTSDTPGAGHGEEAE